MNKKHEPKDWAVQSFTWHLANTGRIRLKAVCQEPQREHKHYWLIDSGVNNAWGCIKHMLRVHVHQGYQYICQETNLFIMERAESEENLLAYNPACFLGLHNHQHAVTIIKIIGKLCPLQRTPHTGQVTIHAKTESITLTGLSFCLEVATTTMNSVKLTWSTSLHWVCHLNTNIMPLLHKAYSLWDISIILCGKLSVLTLINID